MLHKCSSKLEKDALQKKHGSRVSCLLDLDYFDPVRMTPTDPMHNLFLGSAKHMINFWETCLLNENDLLKIQDKVGNCLCPSDVGKLPQKFASSFGSFNADQWKNWTILLCSPEPKIQGSFSDQNLPVVSRCRRRRHCWRCRKLFTLSSSSEPLGQLQQNLAQSILG